MSLWVAPKSLDALATLRNEHSGVINANGFVPKYEDHDEALHRYGGRFEWASAQEIGVVFEPTEGTFRNFPDIKLPWSVRAYCFNCGGEHVGSDIECRVRIVTPQWGCNKLRYDGFRRVSEERCLYGPDGSVIWTFGVIDPVDPYLVYVSGWAWGHEIDRYSKRTLTRGRPPLRLIPQDRLHSMEELVRTA